MLKKKSFIKKLISTMMGAVITATMIPMTAFAAEGVNASLTATEVVDPTSIMADGQAEVTVNLNALYGTGTKVKLPTDVVMVFDCSGSMSGAKVEKMKEGALQFVSGLNYNLHSVAMVPYGNTANCTKKPKPSVGVYDFSTDVETLKEQVSTMYASGGTPTADAIYAAVDLLEGSTKDVRTIILLTDGAPDNATTTSRAAEDAKAAGCIFYAVGVYDDGGSLANGVEDTMRKMATSAQHMYIASASQLPSKYVQLEKTIGKPGVYDTTVTQTISNQFELVKGSTDNNIPRPTINGNKLTWTLTNVAPGQTKLFYSVKPVEGTKTGTYPVAASTKVSYKVYNNADGRMRDYTAALAPAKLNVKAYPAIGEMTPVSCVEKNKTVVTVPVTDWTFGSDFKLMFGGEELAPTSKVNDKELKFTVSANTPIGKYDVKLINAGKTYDAGIFEVKEYVPTFQYTGMDPDNCLQGKSGVKVKASLTGKADYAPDYAIGFYKDGNLVANASISAKIQTYTTFVVPSGLAPDVYDVIATVRGKQADVGKFTINKYIPPTPEFDSITPESADNKVERQVRMFVKGNWKPASDFKVFFNGIEMKSKASASSVVVTVPKNFEADTYSINVFNEGVETKNVGTYECTQYTYIPPTPSFKSISPESGLNKAAVLVIMQKNGGWSFASDFKVYFDDVEMPVKYTSTMAKITVPKGFAPGIYSINVFNEGVRTDGIGSYECKEYVPDPPTFEDPVPASGTNNKKVTFKLTKKGSWNSTITEVKLGDTVVDSRMYASYLSVTAPQGFPEGTYDIVVTANGIDYVVGTYTSIDYVAPTPTYSEIILNKKSYVKLVFAPGWKHAGSVPKYYLDGSSTPIKSIEVSAYSKIYFPSGISSGTHTIDVEYEGTRNNGLVTVTLP